MRLIAAPPVAPGMLARLAELRGLLDEVADIDWRNPLWWAIAGSAAAALGRAPRGGYLASDAEPRGDTFMGWPEPVSIDLAERIADAIVAARAAVRALEDLDGELPEQPLACHVIRVDGGAAETVAADVTRVAFVIGDRGFLADLDSEPHTDAALAAALARVATGAASADPRLSPIDPRAGGAVPAALVAVIGDDELALARHLHRRAWSRGGGPWLGIGRAGGLTVVSTCHMVVDGYGHAWLAARIASGRDLAARRRLAAAAATVVAASARPAPTLPTLAAVAGGHVLGVAWRRVGPLPRFPVLAHALGRVLHGDEGVRHAAASPTIQVPVAPGDRDDPLRWRRRVVPALLSVRFSDGSAEPVERFAERSAAILRREAAGAGLMSRLLDAARAAPAPLAWKRRVVGSATRPLLLAPITRVLGGRACLSVLRLGVEIPPAPPLIAVSSPGLLPSIIDAGGSTVITAISDAHGATLTASGCGRTGAAAGADDLLDRLLAAIGEA